MIDWGIERNKTVKPEQPYRAWDTGCEDSGAWLSQPYTQNNEDEHVFLGFTECMYQKGLY